MAGCAKEARRRRDQPYEDALRDETEFATVASVKLTDLLAILALLQNPDDGWKEAGRTYWRDDGSLPVSPTQKEGGDLSAPAIEAAP